MMNQSCVQSEPQWLEDATILVRVSQPGRHGCPQLEVILLNQDGREYRLAGPLPAIASVEVAVGPVTHKVRSELGISVFVPNSHICCEPSGEENPEQLSPLD